MSGRTHKAMRSLYGAARAPRRAKRAYEGLSNAGRTRIWQQVRAMREAEARMRELAGMRTRVVGRGGPPSGSHAGTGSGDEDPVLSTEPGSGLGVPSQPGSIPESQMRTVPSTSLKRSDEV